MKRQNSLLICFVILCRTVGVDLFAEVPEKNNFYFAPLFNDGVVLQCEIPVNVWGGAEPGITVNVTFAGQKKSVVADLNGKWMVQFDPMAVSFEPRTLTASAGNRQLTIDNVLVGEVWLATGQSNMVIPLSGSDNGADRLKKTIPEIWFVKVPQRTGLPVEKEFTAEELKWNEFKPGLNQQIAAVAFYFAEKIQTALKCPVGIIQSSYGGTPCEAWAPMCALEKYPDLQYLANEISKGLASGRTKEEWMESVVALRQWFIDNQRWRKTKQGLPPKAPEVPGKDNPWSSESPTVLYENMIRPLIPYTTRGVIWYQGESNTQNSDEYHVLFPAMIEAWRVAWNRPDWPFFFVQISAFEHQAPGADWPGIRAAQTEVRNSVPHTGMAMSIDCGEKANIHPRAKQPVGERLARLALDQVYGQDVVSRGPVFQTLEKAGSKIRVVFQCSEQGLQASDGNADIPGFEVAGADGQFCAADAKIVSSDTIELVCTAVRNPVAVRYAWANWIEPPVTLQNSSGLPAEPFMRELDR